MEENDLDIIGTSKPKKDKKRKVKVEVKEEDNNEVEVMMEKNNKKKKKNKESEIEVKKEVEEREEVDVADEPEYRKNKKYGKLIQEDEKEKFMSLEECMETMKQYRGNSKGGAVVKQRLLRHISLPYHLSGSVAVKNAIDFLAQKTVGKYKKEAKGVVIKVGNVDLISKPRIISDQNVFHWDVYINQIVFTPKIGDVYEAVAQYNAGGMIIGTVMGLVSIFVQENEKTSEDAVDVNDRILVKYSSMKIKASLCQLHGTYVKMIAKAGPESDQKPVRAGKKGEAPRTSRKFVDDDNELESA